jgi:uncharacterized membrane protein (DUF4010 family)
VTLSLDLAVAGDLSVATLAGLAVGIEREWSGHATGPAARFAGARTFLLLGFIGGVAGWLAAGGSVVLGAVVLAGAALLVTAAYVMAARSGPEAVEGTTEVAALAVLALGTAAGLGFPLLTSAAVSVLLLALVEKTRIHSLIARIGEREMAAALQFAVLALVILPLLPNGPYGPFGAVRPRALWLVVLLLSALNFAGYVARRAVGEGRGYGLTGLLGGIVSSTAVTLSFSGLSRQRPEAGGGLAAGVMGACTVLLARVLVLSAVLNAALLDPLMPYLVPPLVVGIGLVTAALVPKSGGESGAEHQPESRNSNPLGLWSALRMALAFQVVLIIMPLANATWGDTGVLTSAAIVGITDMDALTLAMAKLGSSPESLALAAHGIGIGLLASTLLRLGIAMTVGAGPFRRKVGVGLAALAAAVGLGIWLGARTI